MKTNRIAAVAIALLALPVATWGQRNFLGAIDKFTADADRNGIYAASKDAGWNSSDDHYSSWEFKLPLKETKKIATMRDAFFQDLPGAYSSLVRYAGNGEGVEQRIGYGENLKKSVVFGSHASHNYLLMLVRDPQDSLRRTASALVWWEEGGRLRGSIHIIRGLDPQRVAKDGDEARAGSTATVTWPLTQADYDSLKTGTSLLNGVKEITMQGDGTAVIDYKDGRQLVVKNGNVVRTSTGGVTRTVATVHSDAPTTTLNVRYQDSQAFLQRFGSLRVAFLSTQGENGTAVLTSLANSLLSLVKTNAHLLSADEKKLCIDSLKEMRGYVGGDTFIQGTLDLAIKELR